MNRADSASARHHTYLLLSRLYLDGLTADLLPYLDEIPELAVVTPRPFNPDEAAADHYGIFAHEIFPYESIFRDPSGLLGGHYADQVNAKYKHAGVQISAEPDHIGHELAFLAALCKAESQAMGDEGIELAGFFEHQQGAFLQDHLLYWLSPFVSALSFSSQPFYEALGRLTLELIYDHLLTIREVGSTESFGDRLDSNTTEIRDMLQDDQTGLKQIASFLIAPPSSGFFIGQATISALARKRQLPRGFGTRQQMLSNLFHSAAQYDLIPALFQDLSSHSDSWTKRYEEQMLAYPEMGQWIQPWLERVTNTRLALSELRSLSIATG